MRKRFVVVLLLAAAVQSSAQTNAPKPDTPDRPVHPAINWFYRWLEDWSVLADPSLRTDPLDPIKYVPIGSAPKSYLSLGLTVRERFESVSFRLTPVQPDDYLMDRSQLHGDLHLGSHVQIVTHVIDAHAPEKSVVAPIDQDRVDLEQAFIAVTVPVGEDELKSTVGRIEPLSGQSLPVILRG